MGTNLHNIRFPISARIQRIKLMVDLRKKKRSQVFRSHRLRHLFASDDHIRKKFYTICQHLDLFGCKYTDEQKFTALLLIMVGGDMPQFGDFIRCELANKLMRHINIELNVLLSGICRIVNEINDDNDVNYHHHDEASQSICVRFENDNLTFRLNINSITDLLVELMSMLLKSYGHRCQTSKMAVIITPDLLRILELCYLQMGHNFMTIQYNLNTALLALTANGVGRLDRTKVIAEYEPLMQYLLNRMSANFGNGRDSLITLQIINNLANGYPENIEHLIRHNLLGHLRNYLVDANYYTSHAIAEQCLCILDNICGNHRSDIQAAIDADLIQPIINVFKSSDTYIGIRKLVLNIFVSISTLGNTKQIKVLLDTDLLQLLCGQLNNRDDSNDTVIEMVLEILTNVLNELYRKDHRVYHQECLIMSECGGFMAINRLIGHNSESISNVALQLNQHNGNNVCTKCNKSFVDAITIEQMQQ